MTKEQQHQLTRAMQARYLKCRRNCEFIRAALDEDSLTISGARLQEIRDALEDSVQAFHEYNAYRNALQTIKGWPDTKASKGDKP